MKGADLPCESLHPEPKTLQGTLIWNGEFGEEETRAVLRAG
jgi:hypothetical protein